YQGNYVIYYLNSASSHTMLMVIASGLASAVGFATAGIIADKIGRKWTVSIGLFIAVAALVGMVFIRPTGVVAGANGEFTFPFFLYITSAVEGFGMALVHNCSFPMVVELCTSKKIGKFTGYYYASSMAAQTVTPVLLGFLFMRSGAWGVLPIYAAILTALSALVFAFFVKNIKAQKITNYKGIEAFSDDD
ncbi:MAG: MFS transporter, partial [Lachnospiraceae bacterium]|nr:MFS transporter [Lachnospiraceae bacterium]